MQIISALNPRRRVDDFTDIWMEVWFEEFSGPLTFCATLFDCEPHGRELWFRAMKGEYGEISVIEEVAKEPPQKLLEYRG
jgi:hypothetical protein